MSLEYCCIKNNAIEFALNCNQFVCQEKDNINPMQALIKMFSIANITQAFMELDIISIVAYLALSAILMFWLAILFCILFLLFALIAESLMIIGQTIKIIYNEVKFCLLSIN